MTDASGTAFYEYTPKGQVKKETKTIDGIQYVTLYTYDMNGNIETMTYPSGRVITYSLSNDRVISVLNGAANLATNISYKPFGSVASITYGNGLAGTIGYDNQYRITGITAGAILNLNYNQYDADGNIKSIQNTLDPTKNKAFDYDAIDRLSTATATGIWGTLGWTYDGVGNRLTENGNNYAYSTNTNKLTSANGISFGYDNNGNTTTEGAKQYIYNQNQRLIQVNNGATTAYYTYNGNGQRVKKVVNGNATVFHYSLNGQLIAESNSAGNITAEYVYLNGQPLAKIEAANIYYYHPDHLGTPQKMTDSTGAIVWAADYKPFGEATVTISTITNNLRFPGQYYDAETGLHYNYYRDYNSATDRYIQTDPLGIDAGNNHPYIYADSNPEMYTDAMGTCPNTVSTGWGLEAGHDEANIRYMEKRTKLDGALVSKSGECDCRNRCDCKNKSITCRYEMWRTTQDRTGRRNKKTNIITWKPWKGDPSFFDGFLTVGWDCETGQFAGMGVLTTYGLYYGHPGTGYFDVH